MEDKPQKPKLSRKENKQQKELLSSLEDLIKITPEELENRIQLGIDKERKRLKWKNLDAATKLSAFLTLMLVITAFVALFFQWQANKTTRENLNIIQQEFELNSRPYISVETADYNINRDTLNLKFVVKNYGSIPGKIELTKIPAFKKPFKLSFDPIIEKTTIYPNHSLNINQLQNPAQNGHLFLLKADSIS